MDALFAEPSAAEIANATADWAARSPTAADIVIEENTIATAGALNLRVRVVSHDVDGTRHYGAIITSADLAGPAPIIVYTHGGDGGASVEEVVALFPFVGDLSEQSVWVVPSFRSETLRFAGASWTSDGPPSPWDRDVDDALALLDVTLAVEPAADADRVSVIGLSRGAGVGMLMGIRDDRIDRIVEFFGPTDFFGIYVQDIVEDALLGAVRDLPGLDFLNESFIQPLKQGELTIPQVRQELVLRSAVLHAAELPLLQLHHGTADPVVDVSQAESLIETMADLGRTESTFEAFLYPGGGHNPLTLTGSIGRAVNFLSAAVAATTAN